MLYYWPISLGQSKLLVSKVLQLIQLKQSVKIRLVLALWKKNQDLSSILLMFIGNVKSGQIYIKSRL
jgi:hypothetical protein